MVFFGQIVLSNFSVNDSQVVVAFFYVTMVFTVNRFLTNETLLLVFFSLIALTKVTENKALQSKIICLYQLIPYSSSG